MSDRKIDRERESERWTKLIRKERYTLVGCWILWFRFGMHVARSSFTIESLIYISSVLFFSHVVAACGNIIFSGFFLLNICNPNHACGIVFTRILFLILFIWFLATPLFRSIRFATFCTPFTLKITMHGSRFTSIEFVFSSECFTSQNSIHNK